MSTSAQVIPIMNYDDNIWKNDLFGFLNEKIDELGETPMMKIEDFTKPLFENKSEILGQLVLALIKKNHSDLMTQKYCDCPICGKNLKVWNPEAERDVESMGGTFTLGRPYFYCRLCKHGFYPLDEALGLSPSPKQYDIQDVEAWLASELTFKMAQEAFGRCVGDSLSADHIHTTTNNIAGHLDILDICPTKAEIEQKIDNIGKGNFRHPIMVLAVDGAHAPTRPEPSPWKGDRGNGEYKEVKGFRLYLIDKKQIVHLISWHQIGDDKELAAKLTAVKDAGLIPEGKVRLCIIGDGAPWIWNRTSEIFPSAKAILDFYHCSEYLHAAANTQYGKGTEQARQLVEVCLVWLFQNDLDNAVGELRSIEPVSAEARKKINAVVKYLIKHEEKINYGAAKRGGYHIGSGAIESANKFIGHIRIKRSGAWWYVTNANNMLKLRCAKINGTYNRVVKQYIELDRKRTYQKR